MFTMTTPRLAPIRISRPRDRPRQGVHQSAGQTFHGVRAGAVALDDGELVAPHARDAVLGAQLGTQTLGHDLQQFIAGGVPQAVIDILEMVQVQQIEGEGGVVAAQARQFPIEGLAQEVAVGKPGEGIVEGQEMDALLLFQALADVTKGDRGPGQLPVNQHRIAPQLDGNSAAVAPVQGLPESMAGASVQRRGD
jgi:hypothetical protein